MISNINYSDENIFFDELKGVFHDSWFYVGLKRKLENRNDYITYKCGEVSVFVQNFGERLKCFSNICLHRFNSIHLKEEGNSHLICSYHNWVYDDEGIPQIRSECLKEELIKCERGKLKEFEVETCGDFVFVKINQDNRVSLRDYLGDFYGKLIDLSHHFDTLICNEKTILGHKANWKLLVENVLECYHCSSVHKKTLVPIGIGGKKPENHTYNCGHDMVDYPMRTTAAQSEREEKLSFLNKSLYLHKSLQHWYVFPNLFITSTAGNLFYVGKLTPNKKDYTQLHAYFIKPKYGELSKKEHIILNAYLNTAIDSSIKVILEDRAILEEIQENLYIQPHEAQVFGEEEFRIKTFHEKIKNKIKYK